MLSLVSRRLALVLALAPLLLPASAPADDRPGPRLSHVVFFTLKDHSAEARRALVESCRKHLDGHEGVASFSVGTIAEDVREPVSDRDFDVAIHLVFRDKAASDAYQSHPRHRQFIDENKATWAKVRVFDSYLASP